MLKYDAEFKESLLKKIFTKNDNIFIYQIIIEANVSPALLCSWVEKSMAKKPSK